MISAFHFLFDCRFVPTVRVFVRKWPTYCNARQKSGQICSHFGKRLIWMERWSWILGFTWYPIDSEEERGRFCYCPRKQCIRSNLFGRSLDLTSSAVSVAKDIVNSISYRPACPASTRLFFEFSNLKLKLVLKSARFYCRVGGSIPVEVKTFFNQKKLF